MSRAVQFAAVRRTCRGNGGRTEAWSLAMRPTSKRSRRIAFVLCGVIGAFLTFFALLEYAFAGFHKSSLGLEVAGLALPALLVNLVLPPFGEAAIWTMFALELICAVTTGGNSALMAILLLTMGILLHASSSQTSSKL
jgi:hypothetical protein